MKKIITSIVAAAAMTVLCAGFCFAADIDTDSMTLVWSDEFEGTELNTDYWTCMIGDGSLYGNYRWGNNELQFYMSDNATVSDGTLKITAQYESVNGYSYTSARLTTDGKVEVGMGYVEARIKLPSINGVWPAFWMLGTNGETWPACGEIDIMETYNTGQFAQYTIHWADSNGDDSYLYGSKSTNFDKTEWHTYGVYRDGTSISFYIDGEWQRTYDTATDETRSELNDDYYILLNIACGGNLTQGYTPSSSDLPVSMEVDYVRYYVDGTEETTTSSSSSSSVSSETTTSAAVTVKKAKIKKLKNLKRKRIRVSLKKLSKVTGYQIRYCDNKKFDGYMSKKTKKAKVILKGLDKNTKYYVKARAYIKTSSGKIYGKWSKRKSVKVKK